MPKLLKQTWVWLSFLAIGLLGGCHSTDRGTVLSKQKAIDEFNKIYYDSKLWQDTKWLGIPLEQTPTDCWIMQEIIFEIKPDFIIETGTYLGGSALFYATVLEQANPEGKVITVDIKPQANEASKFEIFKDKVTFIKGSSVSPQVLETIDKELKKGSKILVTLDSAHRAAYVLKELNLYSRFVSLNSYLVVQDTHFNGHPVLPSFGPGPREAVDEFLKTNHDFVIDHSKEKFLLTWYPSGFLKRIK